MLKKEPEANKKFKEKFLNNEVFPKCFECNKNNPDKLEKCAFCGADLKIKLLDESTPNGILSFDNMLKEKPVQHSAAVIAYSATVFSLLSISINLNICLLFYFWFIKDDFERHDKEEISYLKAKADAQDGIIRYLIPQAGGDSIDDSGKRLNRIPVYYNHYDKKNKGFATIGITMMEPEETLAINHAVEYNRCMSRAINYKDYIKQNKDSMIIFSGPCDCGQRNHNAKIRIFPKCYFDQKVIVKLPGNADFQGTVCGIETDKAGKITYAIRIDSQTVRKDIPEDNITLIPEEPKTEAPSVAAHPHKK